MYRSVDTWYTFKEEFIALWNGIFLYAMQMLQILIT